MMFSVVIPLYNKASTIAHTLSSVLTQTFHDFEIIIVNDGSTDNGVEIIENFTNDSRIRIINQNNQGVSVARNRGVAEAKYEYIAFLDGDDAWMPCFLETIKKAKEKFPDAGMYGTPSRHYSYTTGEGGNDTTLRSYRGKIQVINYLENPDVFFHTSAIVMRKSVFSQIDNGNAFPPGMKCCEDLTCEYRMGLLAPVVYAGFPLGIRYNGVQGQITGAGAEERFQLLPYVVQHYNIVLSYWQKQYPDNTLFPIFMKYVIRARILSFLRQSDYRSLYFFLDGIDSEVKKILPKCELQMFRKKQLRLLGMLYIYVSKIIWRRHGFPIVGHNTY